MNKEIIAHLTMLHKLAEPYKEQGLLCLASGGEGHAWEQAFFEIGDIEAMLGWMTLHAASNRNYYASLCVYQRKERKLENVIAVLGLCADFDDAEAVQYGDRLPLSPDMVLETSPKRFQAFFFFPQPQTDIQKTAMVAKALVEHTQCDHGTGDLVHVWRIAGTVNYPNAKKLAAGRAPEGVAVQIKEEIADILTDFALLEEKLQPLTMAELSPTEGGAHEALASELPYVPAWLKEKLTVSPAEGERSEHIYNTLGNLKEQRFTPEQAFQTALAHQDGFMTKHKGHPERIHKEVSRCYNKADGGSTSIAAVQGAPNKLRFMSRSELARLKPPTYLIEGWLPDRGLACFTGEPGSGKTFMALDVVARIATGLPFMGRKTKQARVLYLTPEGTSGISPRLKAWEMQHGMEIEDGMMGVCTQHVALNDPEDLPEIRAAVDVFIKNNGKIGMLVFDTVAQTMNGEENASKDMKEYIAAVNSLAERYSCLVLLIHHGPKPTGEVVSGSRLFRGHSSLYGALDLGVSFKVEDEEQKLLSVNLTEKVKDGEPIGRLYFRLKKMALGMNAEGKPLTSCVLEPLKRSEAEEVKAKPAPVTKASMGRDAILEALESGHKGRKELIDLVEGITPAAKEQACSRILKELTEKGKITSLGRGEYILMEQRAEMFFKALDLTNVAILVHDIDKGGVVTEH